MYWINIKWVSKNMYKIHGKPEICFNSTKSNLWISQSEKSGLDGIGNYLEEVKWKETNLEMGKGVDTHDPEKLTQNLTASDSFKLTFWRKWSFVVPLVIVSSEIHRTKWCSQLEIIFDGLFFNLHFSSFLKENFN